MSDSSVKRILSDTVEAIILNLSNKYMSVGFIFSYKNINTLYVNKVNTSLGVTGFVN